MAVKSPFKHRRALDGIQPHGTGEFVRSGKVEETTALRLIHCYGSDT